MKASLLALSLLLGGTLASPHSPAPKPALDVLLKNDIDFCREFLDRVKTTTRYVVYPVTKTLRVFSTKYKTIYDTKVVKQGTKTVTLRPKKETSVVTITPPNETQTNEEWTTIVDTSVATEIVTSTYVVPEAEEPPVFSRAPAKVKRGVRDLPRKLRGYERRHVSSACSKVLKNVRPVKITRTSTKIRKVTSTKKIYAGVVTKYVYKRVTITVPRKTTTVQSTSRTTTSTTLKPQTDTIVKSLTSFTTTTSTTTSTTTITQISPPAQNPDPPTNPCAPGQRFWPGSASRFSIDAGPSVNPPFASKQYSGITAAECFSICATSSSNPQLQPAGCAGSVWDVETENCVIYTVQMNRECWTTRGWQGVLSEMPNEREMGTCVGFSEEDGTCQGYRFDPAEGPDENIWIIPQGN